VGAAGHGAIDSEELVTVRIDAGGATGEGYASTIGRGGRAIQAVIEHDLAPLLLGRDERDIAALWETMRRRLLFVGRGGLTSFAIAAADVALWDLRGRQAGTPLYALLGAAPRPIPAYGSGVDLPKPLPALLAPVRLFLERGFEGVKVKE
jgi:L-alanine-DL-glutamate epimerase-like enolase superfamily enzyme